MATVLIVLTVMLAVVPALPIQGAARSGPGSIAVPELDQQTLEIGSNSSSPFIGRSAADVLRAVGAPADKISFKNGPEEWAYAVRAWSPVKRFRIPAAILRIEFDAAGVVTDWYFRGPRSHTRLPVRESLADAQRFLSSICRQPVPEIDLQAGLKRKQSTKRDVAALLTPVLADKGWRRAHAREEAMGAGLAWEYYVDRPSPVFIPPFYVVVRIQNSSVKTISPEGYGGCL